MLLLILMQVECLIFFAQKIFFLDLFVLLEYNSQFFLQNVTVLNNQGHGFLNNSFDLFIRRRNFQIQH